MLKSNFFMTFADSISVFNSAIFLQFGYLEVGVENYVL